ncbi:MAG: galactosyltransferase-related protein, partial [Sphingobium sp.]
VCNVDADNFLPEGFTREIERRMERGTDVVSFRAVTIPGFLWARYGRKLLGMRRAPSGLFGRIAVRKSLFDAIGGYNENLKGWGGDDIDFLLRARNSGAKLDLLPARLWGTTIGHEDEERLANYSDEDRAVSAALMRKERLRDMVDRIRRLLTHKDVTADTEPFSRRFTLTEVECNIFHLAPV